MGVEEVEAAHNVQRDAMPLLIPAQLQVRSQRHAQVAACISQAEETSEVGRPVAVATKRHVGVCVVG